MEKINEQPSPTPPQQESGPSVEALMDRVQEVGMRPKPITAKPLHVTANAALQVIRGRR